MLATSVLLWSSVLKLTKKFSSTSFNLKQGLHHERWRKDLKRVIYIGKIILTLMDQRTWTVKLIFTPCQAVQWSLTSVTRCGELLQLSSDTCECVNYFGGIFEGMTLLNSCQVLKSWPWSVYVVVPSIG